MPISPAPSVFKDPFEIKSRTSVKAEAVEDGQSSIVKDRRLLGRSLHQRLVCLNTNYLFQLTPHKQGKALRP